MPRAVPSKWKPKGIELLEVRGLFDSSSRLKILDRLGSTSASRAQRVYLLNRSMNAAAWLRAELHYAARPGKRQAEAAITPVAKSTKKLKQLLIKLDHQSRILIEQAADEDDVANERNNNELPRMRLPVTIEGKIEWHENSFGSERFRTIVRALEDLERWTAAAPALCPIREEPKTVRALAIRSAIRTLEEIWREAWAKREHADPKLARFLPFVQAVLNPVLGEGGGPQELKKATEEVLHGAGRGHSTEEEHDLYLFGGSA